MHIAEFPLELSKALYIIWVHGIKIRVMREAYTILSGQAFYLL